MDTRDRITIRLTPAQAARLEEMATRLQLSATEVLRRCLEHVTVADLARSASAPEVSASPPLSLADLADGVPEPASARQRQGVTYAELMARIQCRADGKDPGTVMYEPSGHGSRVP